MMRFDACDSCIHYILNNSKLLSPLPVRALAHIFSNNYNLFCKRLSQINHIQTSFQSVGRTKCTCVQVPFKLFSPQYRMLTKK